MKYQRRGEVIKMSIEHAVSFVGLHGSVIRIHMNNHTNITKTCCDSDKQMWKSKMDADNIETGEQHCSLSLYFTDGGDMVPPLASTPPPLVNGCLVAPLASTPPPPELQSIDAWLLQLPHSAAFHISNIDPIREY